MLAYITWGIDPSIFEVFGREIRWYGVLFASSFIFGQLILTKFFKEEKVDIKLIDSFTIYGVLGTVIGARLGHCFFYQPDIYLTSIDGLLSIFKIWEGGLASHGAGIGLMLATFIFVKKNKIPYPWMLDKVVLVVALAGFCIRTGNFCNSEIIGVPTNSSHGVVFYHNAKYDLAGLQKSGFVNGEISILRKDGSTELDGQHYQNMELNIPIHPNTDITYAKAIAQREVIDVLMKVTPSNQHIIFEDEIEPTLNGNIITIKALGVPRHPSQLYEALTSLALFLFLFFNHHKFRGLHGFSFGVFMVYVFSLRFAHELFKENQVTMEDGWILNMGQLLSIPMILIGGFAIWNAVKNKNIDAK